MIDFPLHTKDSAPEASKVLLDGSVKAFGMIPNLHAVMAEAPGLLKSYKFLHDEFMHTSFNADEKTVVWQTINVEHACHYCVPAHTGIAKSMKVSDEVTDALRNETPLPSARLEALRRFTQQVVRQRGVVGDADVNAFLTAGYTKRQVLEVVLGVAQKVMSNYVNHLAHTPIDKPFAVFEWQKTA